LPRVRPPRSAGLFGSGAKALEGWSLRIEREYITLTDSPDIPRIGPEDTNRLTYHGPVDLSVSKVQRVTFTGSEESDLLHAAGSWMTEHPDAIICGINWLGDDFSPHDYDPPRRPLHRLDLTVVEEP